MSDRIFALFMVILTLLALAGLALAVTLIALVWRYLLP